MWWCVYGGGGGGRGVMHCAPGCQPHLPSLLIFLRVGAQRRPPALDTAGGHTSGEGVKRPGGGGGASGACRLMLAQCMPRRGAPAAPAPPPLAPPGHPPRRHHQMPAGPPPPSTLPAQRAAGPQHPGRQWQLPCWCRPPRPGMLTWLLPLLPLHTRRRGLLIRSVHTATPLAANGTSSRNVFGGTSARPAAPPPLLGSQGRCPASRPAPAACWTPASCPCSLC
jgi:hypothetical protein